MPRVTRKRVIAAPPGEVWKVVSDPYHLPRWWPKTIRVENVSRAKGGRRTQWTSVLETKGGRAVRADYRVISSAERDRFVFEQELENTPFEKVLRGAVTEVSLRQADDGTEVKLTAKQQLRGVSRLGSPLMGSGQRKILEEALDGLERAVSGAERDAP